MSVTEPLREEHRELLPKVETLREAAEAAGADDRADLVAKVEKAYSFLTGHLIPHALAEDAALYPVVGRVMGAEAATRTMSRDHVEVGRLTDRLAQLRERLSASGISQAERGELQQVLYGLYALVRLHFAKEEEVYLPLLDQALDERSASEMFEAMEAAAAQAKARQTS